MFAVRRWILLLAGCSLVAFAGFGTAGPPAPHPAIPRPSTSNPPPPVPLAGGWSYRSDRSDVGISQDWGRAGAPKGWTPVAIPNDFNSMISGAADAGTVGWYRVRFTGPQVSAGRSWNVSFESVRRSARVWLNGRQIGSSSDPYAPFSLPASGLVPGAPNVLVVRVDDFRGRGSMPEDWWNWGGIMGPVTLAPAGRISLNDLGLIPELGCGYRCGGLLVRGTLHNRSAVPLAPAIVVTTTSPTGLPSTTRHPEPQLAPGASTPIGFRVPVAAPLALWSTRSPSLYRVQVQTVAQGRVEQAEGLRIGMRSVQVRRGILYLNGRRLWLHGAAIHEDVQGRGAALTDGDIDTIVSQLRSAGANITRAHYLLSKRLLDALDAAGVMVWEQPPIDHADAALQTPGGRAVALSMLESTIIGARNHPSVIVDSVGNELSPTPDTTPGTRAYLDQAIPLARALDPVVPVALDTYCYPGFPAQRIYSGLDVIGISSYFGWYTGPPGHSIADFDELQPFLEQSHVRYPHQALVVSEFGAEGLFDGAPTTKGSYEFQSGYLRRTFGVLDRLGFMNGAIYWALREFAEGPGWIGGASLPPGAASDGLHHKGLIAYDGTEKPAFAVAQHLFASTPDFVH